MLLANSLEWFSAFIFILQTNICDNDTVSNRGIYSMRNTNIVWIRILCIFLENSVAYKMPPVGGVT